MPSETKAPEHEYIQKGIEGFDERIPQGNVLFTVSAFSSEEEKTQERNIIIRLNGYSA